MKKVEEEAGSLIDPEFVGNQAKNFRVLIHQMLVEVGLNLVQDSVDLVLLGCIQQSGSEIVGHVWAAGLEQSDRSVHLFLWQFGSKQSFEAFKGDCHQSSLG